MKILSKCTGGSHGNTKANGRVAVIRGRRLLDSRRRADAADILVEGDTIRAVGPAGMKAPAGASVVDARGMLLHPGLVNAHTHGHGNLGKGMGDRWTLELLLTASPWLAGHRTTQDKYLGTLIGAAEMALKGCTACYDLSFEFPTPSVEGMNAAAQAYRDVGIRAVVAPMVADHSFYERSRADEMLPRRCRRTRAVPARAVQDHAGEHPSRAARLEGRSRSGAPGRRADDPTPLQR
jgi:cytosine/adenosine deaminase-related metal-dependent hydrolase